MFMRSPAAPVDQRLLQGFIKRNIVHGLQEGDYATPLTFLDAAALCKVVECDKCPDYIISQFRDKVQQGLANI